MRHAYIYALLLLTGTMTLRAQTADPLNFSARFEHSAGIPGQPDDVLLKWASSAGYRDVLETTTDLITWSPVLPPLCGYGQTWSVSVPDARSTPGAGSGPNIPVYSYSQRRYADGSLVLTWTANGVPWRKNFAASSTWAQLAWPGAMAYHKADPNPPLTPWRVLIINFSANPNANPFPESTNLTPAAQAYLDRLLILESDLTAAIAAGPPEPGPQNAGTASGGQHALYRVRREILDTDDDLLNDCQEYTWGFTDENNAYTHSPTRLDTNEDFDSDGYNNYTELAYGTNLVSGVNPPSNDVSVYFEGSQPYLLITAPVWQDTRKPYRYEILERLGGGPWQELNPYTRLIPAYTQPASVGGMELLSFRSNTPLFPCPNPSLDVRISPRWPSHALKHPHAPVRKADWKAHNNAHIESLVPANEFGRNLFDRYHPTGNAQWARWCWTNQLDYTGVSFNDGYNFPPGIARLNTGGYPFVISAARTGTTATLTTVGPHHLTPGASITVALTSGPAGYAELIGPRTVSSTPTTDSFTYTTTTTGTITEGPTLGEVKEAAFTPWPYSKWGCEAEVMMITPIHGIFSGHWPGNRPEDSTITFHKKNGEVVVRTIAERYPPVYPSPIVHEQGIVRLDEPVPEGIKIYKLLPPLNSDTNPDVDYRGAKMIVTSRELEAFPYWFHPGLAPQWISNLVNLLQSPPGTSQFYQFPDRGTGINHALVGDSSDPCFMFFKGEQVLVGHLKEPGGVDSFYGDIAAGVRFYVHPGVYASIVANVARLTHAGENYSVQTITFDP